MTTCCNGMKDCKQPLVCFAEQPHLTEVLDEQDRKALAYDRAMRYPLQPGPREQAMQITMEEPAADWLVLVVVGIIVGLSVAAVVVQVLP